MIRSYRKLLAAALLGLAPFAAPGATLLTVTQTDITGQQSFLNADVGYLWDFSFSQSETFTSGVKANFTVKRNGSATGPATVNLYELGVSISSPLATYSLAVGSATQSFVGYDFVLTNSSITFATAKTYRLTLTSSATGSGNDTWFIKDPTQQSLSISGSSYMSFTTTGGATTYNAQTYNPSTTATPTAPTVPTTAVPDSASTLSLAVLSLGAALVARRRKD